MLLQRNAQLALQIKRNGSCETMKFGRTSCLHGFWFEILQFSEKKMIPFYSSHFHNEWLVQVKIRGHDST